MITVFAYFVIAAIVMVGIIINESKHNSNMNSDIRDGSWWITWIVISLLWPVELAIWIYGYVTEIVNSIKTES